MCDYASHFPRFFYWLSPDDFEEFKSLCLRKRVRPTPIFGVPCKVMHPLVELGYVPPEQWNHVCARQGAWHRRSPKGGKFLVVSLKPVHHIAPSLSGIITTTSFKPPTRPDDEDLMRLVEDPAYQRLEPEEWRNVTDRERRHWHNLLSRLGVRQTLDELIEIHSANHANFVTPHFYVNENGLQAPYSIRNSGRVCSACVELFNLLGEGFEKKYVMPCPGFVVYANHPRDRFLAVLSGNQADRALKMMDGMDPMDKMDD